MSYMKSFEYVKTVLSGCGFESLLVELGAILRNLIDEYVAHNITDEQFNGYVADICNSLSELASRCNKSLSIEVCVNELGKRLKSDAAAGTGVSLLEKFRERLKKKPATSGGSPSVLGFG